MSPGRICPGVPVKRTVPYAVWAVGVPTVDIVPPVVRILPDGDDGISQLLVQTDVRLHVVGDDYAVLPFAEKIYDRLPGLSHECIGLCL